MKKLLFTSLVILIYGCGEKPQTTLIDKTTIHSKKAPICGDKNSIDLVYEVIEREVKSTIEKDINNKRMMQAGRPGDRDSWSNYEKVSPQEVEGFYKVLNPKVINIVTEFQDDNIQKSICSATVTYSNNTSENIKFSLAVTSENKLLINLSFID